MNKIKSGIKIYSLTPPKESISGKDLDSLNRRRVQRLSGLNHDLISIYDVQEESSRTDKSRIYSYTPAINPFIYGKSLSKYSATSQIIYLAAGKYSKNQLDTYYRDNPEKSFVIVGSPGKDTPVKTTLNEAFKISRKYHNNTGGVVIGERHNGTKSEVDNLHRKIANGSSFFISQCIYNYNIYEKLLFDYIKESRNRKIDMVPIIFTFSPIGNIKGLEFMKWLGVDIPKDFIDNIPDRDNFLEYSSNYLIDLGEKLISLCKSLNIPYGLNFESIISKKEEVLASIEIAKRL